MQKLMNRLDRSHDHYHLSAPQLNNELASMLQQKKHSDTASQLIDVITRCNKATSSQELLEHLKTIRIDLAKLSSSRTERLRSILQATSSAMAGLVAFGLMVVTVDSTLLSVTISGVIGISSHLSIEYAWRKFNPYNRLLRKLALYVQTHNVLLTFQFEPSLITNTSLLNNGFVYLHHYISNYKEIANGKILGNRATLLTLNRDTTEDIAIIVDLPASEKFPLFFAHSENGKLPRYLHQRQNAFTRTKLTNKVSPHGKDFFFICDESCNQHSATILANQLAESLSFIFFELPYVNVECNGTQLLLSTQYQLIPNLKLDDDNISEQEIYEHLHDPISVDQLKIYTIIANLITSLSGLSNLDSQSVTA
ncbi:hypothetical protein [Photobacterium damselae]|uniref:hypothetical protein n=1 Tax=Photobacterium damselae TaxID=38293 RepID=UPI004068DBC7